MKRLKIEIVRKKKTVMEALARAETHWFCYINVWDSHLIYIYSLFYPHTCNVAPLAMSQPTTELHGTVLNLPPESLFRSHKQRGYNLLQMEENSRLYIFSTASKKSSVQFASGSEAAKSLWPLRRHFYFFIFFIWFSFMSLCPTLIPLCFKTSKNQQFPARWVPQNKLRHDTGLVVMVTDTDWGPFWCTKRCGGRSLPVWTVEHGGKKSDSSVFLFFFNWSPEKSIIGRTRPDGATFWRCHCFVVKSPWGCWYRRGRMSHALASNAARVFNMSPQGCQAWPSLSSAESLLSYDGRRPKKVATSARRLLIIHPTIFLLPTVIEFDRHFNFEYQTAWY